MLKNPFLQAPLPAIQICRDFLKNSQVPHQYLGVLIDLLGSRHCIVNRKECLISPIQKQSIIRGVPRGAPKGQRSSQYQATFKVITRSLIMEDRPCRSQAFWQPRSSNGSMDAASLQQPFPSGTNTNFPPSRCHMQVSPIGLYVLQCYTGWWAEPMA